jgi:pimeloyl-ACP methyl ester carboxylesterase
MLNRKKLRTGIVLFGLALSLAIGLHWIPAFWRTADPSQFNLHHLYSRSAQYHGPDRNPVIVIPGMVGSVLTTTDRQAAWGMFNLSYNFEQLALPLQPGTSALPLHPDRVLESLSLDLFGWKLEQETYRQILYALGSIGGYRDSTMAMFEGVDYGDDHFTCFQFPYDWRQDNVSNAQRLHQFILEKRQELQREYRRRYGIEAADIEFDIVAHSMGGLLTRYFLRYGDRDLPADGSLPEVTWEGASYVDRVILIGTPNAGSLDAFVNLTHGTTVKPFNLIHDPIPALANWFGKLGIGPVNPPRNAVVFDTFTSLYQMIPRPRQRPVIDAETRRGLDLFDIHVWEQRQWGLLAPGADATLQRLLPDVPDASDRYHIAHTHLARNLDRARQFQQALDQPATAPAGLDLQLIVGDTIPTPQTITASTDGSFQLVSTASGDGKVLRQSALLDERTEADWAPQLRSPIPWQQVSFYVRSHVKLVQDSALINNLLFTLLEQS